MAMMLLSLLLFLLISLFVSFGSAEIRLTEIRSDFRSIIPFDEFGFTHTGVLKLSAHQIHLLNRNSVLDLAKLGFFLTTRDAWIHVIQQLADGEIRCALESDLVKLVYDFRSLEGNSNFYTLFRVKNADRYTLLFANCLDQVSVSMTVQSKMLNLDGKNDSPDYLSAGDSMLPIVYSLSSLVYFTLAGIWIHIIYRRRFTVSRIHFFMLAMVILKSLNLIFQSANKSHIEVTGMAADLWNIPIQTLSFLKGIMFFTLLASIGTGWSHLKPFLQHKVNRVLMIVIPLQVVANIVQVLADEAPPFSPYKVAWNTTIMLVDVVCYCTVFLPIVWWIKNLREAAQTDNKAAAYLMKLTQLRQYYIVVICYVYLTRVAVIAMSTFTSFEYLWTGAVVRELATVAFYVFTAYKFMPESQNPYYVIDDEEKDVGAEQLEVEDGEETNGECLQ
ncbi:bis(5'-adenosyl)-triphosphatase-like [Hibiscus syriacus]|uniref:Bis(5'-adenosyl)-triphosphatase-like n=1 Tax=Hibiscus syriacus TaxID=106335 RepID=A0A6A3CHU3_HIBSY|nr:protein CANDIDATE G-PROTEIN COUPLED RECEPTOR 7-like [Hibiscus syriacus]KAE8727011.1 bis(5'-adenosyl)-triphosphatase-like [Hibiscus syriacus]